ncbi:MAG: hypothetical protein IKO06_02970 [Alphaproteobacteria bacterium]|nr:hypothetical protein [Alphaproteobacteria bacterium]
MRNLKIKNIKSHPSLSLAKANASRDLQINFNQAEDALTIPAESRHDYKCGFATQSGRSMIEMLGVLAIIGVLSVGGIAGYSKAMTKYRINKAIEQITLIAGNVRAFWGPQNNYIGVDCWSDKNGTCAAAGCKSSDGSTHIGTAPSTANVCPIVKKAKIFPDEMITVTNGKIMSITNPFGSGVWLGVTNKKDSDNGQEFYIGYNLGDNEEACIELTTHNWQDIDVIAVATGTSSNGPIGIASYTGEGCHGTDRTDPLIGCLNGTSVSLPLPLEKAVNACAKSPEITIYFR